MFFLGSLLACKELRVKRVTIVLVEIIIDAYSRATIRNASNFNSQLASRGYHTRGRYCMFLNAARSLGKAINDISRS